jgi:7,8-dihydroneopterin aldolase/epimerase/oxygenase
VDRIILTRLAVFARHGVMPEEERLGQRFFISLVLNVDLGKAGRSDDVADTVNYGEVADVVMKIATERRCYLIEALAETIATEVLAAYPPVQSLVVKVEKPEAPITHIFDNVAVEIERARHG